MRDLPQMWAPKKHGSGSLFVLFKSLQTRIHSRFPLCNDITCLYKTTVGEESWNKLFHSARIHRTFFEIFGLDRLRGSQNNTFFNICELYVLIRNASSTFFPFLFFLEKSPTTPVLLLHHSWSTTKIKKNLELLPGNSCAGPPVKFAQHVASHRCPKSHQNKERTCI